MSVIVGAPPYPSQILVDVVNERARAHVKHAAGPDGSMEDRDWTDPGWLTVLVEEVGEVATALNERRHGNVAYAVGVVDDEVRYLTAEQSYRAATRSELVQVAAMAVAWIAAIDRAEADDPAKAER